MLNILHNNRCVSPNKLSCIHTGLYKTVSFVARVQWKTDLNTETFCWIIVSAANRKTWSILPHKTLPNDWLWQPCDVLSPVFQSEWKTCVKAFTNNWYALSKTHIYINMKPALKNKHRRKCLLTVRNKLSHLHLQAVKSIPVIHQSAPLVTFKVLTVSAQPHAVHLQCGSNSTKQVNSPTPIPIVQL